MSAQRGGRGAARAAGASPETRATSTRKSPPGSPAPPTISSHCVGAPLRNARQAPTRSSRGPLWGSLTPWGPARFRSKIASVT